MKEAIEILKNTLAYDNYFADAKLMAIKALEQEPCVDCPWRRQGIDRIYEPTKGSDTE